MARTTTAKATEAGINTKSAKSSPASDKNKRIQAIEINGSDSESSLAPHFISFDAVTDKDRSVRLLVVAQTANHTMRIEVSA